MSIQAFQAQRLIEVNVIEREDRKPSRKRAESSKISTHIGFIEMRGHPWSDRAPEPLIEVSQNNPWATQFVIGNDSAIDQLAGLFALFEKPGSKVNVENVEKVIVKPEVSTQAAAPLTPARGDVIVLVALYGKTGQQDIPVPATLVPAILAKRKVKSQFLRDKPCLILFRGPTLQAHNFL